VSGRPSTFVISLTQNCHQLNTNSEQCDDKRDVKRIFAVVPLLAKRNSISKRNQELIAQKLLPPGLELTVTQHTDKGNLLKLKETKYGNSVFVNHDDFKIVTPKN
jgi:hypothetical protein